MTFFCKYDILIVWRNYEKNQYFGHFYDISSLLYAKGNTEQNIQKLYDEGTKYFDSKEFDKAINTYNKGLKDSPNNSLLLSGLAYSYYMKENIDLAIEYCNKAINSDKNNEKPYRYLGYIYFNKKDYNRSIEYFTIVIKLDEKRSDVYNWRGRAYVLIDETLKSINDFEKAIELNPQDDISCSLLAAILFNNSNYTKAISYANRALEINNNNNTAKQVLERAKNNGISINERGISSIEVIVNIGWSMEQYLKEYPYLEADSVNSLIDKRAFDQGKLFTYKFDKTTKKLSLASIDDYSNGRLDIYNTNLTEWIRNGDNLNESNDKGNKIIINLTPYLENEELTVYQ